MIIVLISEWFFWVLFIVCLVEVVVLVLYLGFRKEEILVLMKVDVVLVVELLFFWFFLYWKYWIFIFMELEFKGKEVSWDVVKLIGFFIWEFICFWGWLDFLLVMVFFVCMIVLFRLVVDLIILFIIFWMFFLIFCIWLKVVLRLMSFWSVILRLSFCCSKVFILLWVLFMGFCSFVIFFNCFIFLGVIIIFSIKLGLKGIVEVGILWIC